MMSVPFIRPTWKREYWTNRLCYRTSIFVSLSTMTGGTDLRNLKISCKRHTSNFRILNLKQVHATALEQPWIFYIIICFYRFPCFLTTQISVWQGILKLMQMERLGKLWNAFLPSAMCHIKQVNSNEYILSTFSKIPDSLQLQTCQRKRIWKKLQVTFLPTVNRKPVRMVRSARKKPGR